MKSNKTIVLILLIASFWACDSNRVFEHNISFNNEVWHRDSVLTFNVEITDTLAIYNILLNNRISAAYEFSNMYLFIDAKMPNNKTVRDTLECILRNPSGKPLGKGFGNVWSNKIPYRKHIRFQNAGTYTFTLEQAMRVDELKHVLDAGIRIEKADL